MNKKTVQTSLIHSDYEAPGGFDAFPPGVHRASTVLFENVAAMRSGQWKDKSAYTYGLHGTPTTFTLEARLAQIEGGRHCLLAPSGLSAIAMINFALLRSGDDVLLPENVYNPNRELGRWLSQDFGVSARFYDPMVGAGIADLIQPNTKLVWTEAPGSVSMEVADLPAICKAAKEKGVPVALDNTWSAGLAQGAARDQQGAASGLRGLPGSRQLEARFPGRRRPVLGAVRSALYGRADRPLRRCLESVRHRL
jgi:cystathionine beta-lyase